MKNIILIVIILASALTSFSQKFVSSGKIEFERKVNLHKLYDYEGTWGDYIKKNAPQFLTSYFDLTFREDKSIYKPGREVTDIKANNWKNFPGSENTVFNDYTNASFTSSKQVFEQLFLIQDTLPKMKWKLAAETRKIAGFLCRRAETIIMDSVYIVAFYTDEILATGGPESFNGLPGMILGIAIPRMHVTLFATKLELMDVKDSDLKQPAKGKKTNFANLKTTLQSSMKNWGKEANRNMWFLTI
ncbi:MAG: GLPGLI family protein [Chitinophagaceae bacterium]|nr:MAG: GLPGLI family protein [Chitinophagaceae bacterium]